MRGNRFAAIGMPRHDHGQKRREEPGQRLVRLDQNLVFAGMGGGRDDDRAAARHRHQPLELGGVGRRRGHVELQIARGDDVAAAERRETVRHRVFDCARQMSNRPSSAEMVPEIRRQRGNERCDIRPLISTIGSRRAALDRIRFGHRSDSMNSASDGRQ